MTINWAWYVAIAGVVGAGAAAWILSVPAAAAPAGLAWRRRLTAIAVAVSALLVTAVGARLWSQTYQAFGGDDPLSGSLFRVIIVDTPWGRGWMWQAIGAAACLATALFWRRAWQRWPMFAIAAVATAGATGLTGHAVGMEDGRWITVPAHGVHVVAVGVWLGALAILLLATAGLDRSDAQARQPFASTIERFSPLAVAGVTALFGAGLVAAWRHVGAVDNLWTPYGNALLGKVGAFALAGLCGLYNWRVLRGRLAHSAPAVRQLRNIGRAEVALGLVALFIQTYLGTLDMPGHDH